ncbi:NAD(P)-dependent oxidoreductase [Vibrio sp. ABG19]|uniref:2-hydroxyacid dehydrogenase n=1 Tax=Vibrio sp. ABG19 TaxID=2817385 RepID=UPI00249EF00D|nr:NAD(P)-dependent oxidoreductase [Vibrio sp. ABG19]WGY46856.1 hypothetical protein J0X00_18905 [Vibrio sp. ABG19]
MPSPQSIVLIYKNSSSIPELVIEQIKSSVPTGFALHLCDQTTSDEERRSKLANTQFVMIYSVPFNDFDVLHNVKLVQLLSAGSDLLDLDRFTQLDIPVANNGSVNSWTVAEHAVLLMLSLLRKLPAHHNAMQNGDWLGHQHALSLGELRDKQVGIIGFGHIGQAVAHIVAGFKGKVNYYSRSRIATETEQSLNATWMPLDQLLTASDIITLHTPLVAETRKMLSFEQFSLMKRNALLINTARGAIIHEPALIEALDQGLIAGAALDTFAVEPLPAANPFTNRDNVILTPHMAGTSIDNWQRRIDYCFANILRSVHGEALHSVING